MGAKNRPTYGPLTLIQPSTGRLSFISTDQLAIRLSKITTCARPIMSTKRASTITLSRWYLFSEQTTYQLPLQALLADISCFPLPYFTFVYSCFCKDEPVRGELARSARMIPIQANSNEPSSAIKFKYNFNATLIFQKVTKV